MNTARAVIGIGKIDSAHVNRIGGNHIQGLKLVAACDIAPGLEYPRKSFPVVTPYSDWKQVTAWENSCGGSTSASWGNCNSGEYALCGRCSWNSPTMKLL